MTNKIFRILLVLFSAISFHTAMADEAQLVNRIVAVVNDKPITQVELDDRVKAISQQIEKRGIPLPPPSVLEKQVLENMIMDKIQLEFAAEVGIKVDDEQLMKAMQKIASDNHMTLAQFKDAVEKEDGVPFDKFKEDIRGEIIKSRLRQREVDSKVVVTDAEVNNYLKNSEVQGKTQEYDLSHIFIQLPEQASPDQVKTQLAKAERALQAVRNGADFGQVAASFSDAPDALKGGAIGWKPAGQLPSAFVEMLQKLQPGEVSGIIRSPNGFHIIKLVDRREGKSASVVTQTHVRHILIKTGENVSEEDAKRKLETILAEIRKGADFGQEAKLHSDDTSASNGGDIGWVSPGDTVPAFQSAMDDLKPGQISEPVHTPFGWHLIQVLGSRSEDVGNEKRMLEARKAIAVRKSDEAYQEWLRELRDRAYVVYHLNDSGNQ
ncbi:MAG: molecular chaperone SurA [Burkholderiales bacterium]|nr:molecular chaperone SurA [Burkholderiales bacterium]